MSDLRKLDEEIARMRGWFTTDLGTWTPRDESHAVRDAWDVEVMCGRENDPPPFSSSWALAGVLLEEMADASVDGFGVVQAYCDPAEHDGKCWHAGRHAAGVDEHGFPHGEPTARTPCEAIARAWVAWRQGRA